MTAPTDGEPRFTGVLRNAHASCDARADLSHGNLILDCFYVDEGYRRQRWGSELLVRACDMARMLRLPRVVVECSPRNAPARAFYEKFGFRAVSVVYQLDLDQ